MPPKPDSLPAIAARLLATRLALGYEKQKDFAAKAGVSPTAYNNWEGAVKRPGVEAAIQLCTAFGLTLDWIYRGDASGLPHGLAIKLLEAARRQAAL